MPEGRIQIILEQLDRLLLILASTSQSVKFETSKHKVIVVNDESTSPSSDGGELSFKLSERDIKPESPAYGIFTTGTTGGLFVALIFLEDWFYTRDGLLRSLQGL